MGGELSKSTRVDPKRQAWVRDKPPSYQSKRNPGASHPKQRQGPSAKSPPRSKRDDYIHDDEGGYDSEADSEPEMPSRGGRGGREQRRSRGTSDPAPGQGFEGGREREYAGERTQRGPPPFPMSGRGSDRPVHGSRSERERGGSQRPGPGPPSMRGPPPSRDEYVGRSGASMRSQRLPQFASREQEPKVEVISPPWAESRGGGGGREVRSHSRRT